MRATLGVLVLAALVGGCGASAGTSETAIPRPATLSPAAVPYLPSTHKPLTAALLARETQTPTLVRRLGAWGFVAGSDRYFQGQSHRLQVVDSRTLRFRGAGGAARFVTFMQTHLDSYLGSFPKVRHWRADARRGILAVGQECQCHLANPTLLALLARDGKGTVTWLEINGPGATRERLAALVTQAP
jgi:hypothetical protein